MEGYSVQIKEASREFTGKEKIILKDLTDSIRIDEATAAEALIIKPVDYAILNIHNEKSDTKEYEKLVILAEDGQKYTTGSASFISTFMDIWSDMSGEEEEWELKLYQRESKNYKGKSFLTCSII